MAENKIILEKANAAISAGDYEGFLVHCTDNTEWIFTGDTVLHGKEAVREWMRNTYLEPPKFMVENMVAEGDFVIAIGKIDLKGEDGTNVQHSYCDVWRFTNGKIAGLEAFVIKSKPGKSSLS